MSAAGVGGGSGSEFLGIQDGNQGERDKKEGEVAYLTHNYRHDVKGTVSR